MLDNLPFLFCVVVLAATGAATVRTFLPNVPAFQDDKAKLEVLAWSFSAGAVLLLTAITLLSGAGTGA
jgi:hypothetical protein